MAIKDYGGGVIDISELDEKTENEQMFKDYGGGVIDITEVSVLEASGYKKPTSPEDLRTGLDLSMDTIEERRKREPELEKTLQYTKEVFSVGGGREEQIKKIYADMSGKTLKDKKEAENIYLSLRDLGQRASSPGLDKLSSIGNKGMVLLLGASVVALTITGTPKLWDKIINKKVKTKMTVAETRTLFDKVAQQKATTQEVSKFKTIVDQAEDMGKTLVQITKEGAQITKKVPRFAFSGGTLHGGLPVDKMVKTIVETGKIGADVAKELSMASPEQVSQVIQNLTIASPVIASKLTGELTKLIPQTESGTKWYHGGEAGIKDFAEGMVTKFKSEADEYAKSAKNGIIYEFEDKDIIPATAQDIEDQGNYENVGFIKPGSVGKELSQQSTEIAGLTKEAKKYGSAKEFVESQTQQTMKYLDELYPEYVDVPENNIYDYAEEQDEVFNDILWEYQKNIKNKDYIQNWKVVPAGRITKIWNDYSKTGLVTDEKGINNIANTIIENIHKIEANNILTGHTSINPERYAEDVIGDDRKLPEDYFNKLDSFFDDENGAWRISDFAIKDLTKNAIQLRVATTPEKKLLIIDRLLNIIHARSDLADWFLEGGQKTFNSLAGDVRLSTEKTPLNKKQLTDIWNKTQTSGTGDYTMPSNITSTGEGVGGVDTPPIPEGGEPPPTVDKHNTIFNTTAKKINDFGEKVVKALDVEAPFVKISAPETGFQIKNFHSNIGLAHEKGINAINTLNKFPVKTVATKEAGFKASGNLDYADVTFLSERPGYFVNLSPEERIIASETKAIVKDFYKEWEGKLKKIGWLQEPFPESLISRNRGRISSFKKQLKEMDNPNDRKTVIAEIDKLQKQIDRIKKQKIQFVSIPVKTIIENAETNPEMHERIMSILPKWDRETITVKDLVDTGVLTRKEADIRYILGEYADRMGKKYAIGKIFETAKKEGLVTAQALAPNWPTARIHINGKYVDIPQLRGKRLHPLFSDVVTDFFSRWNVMDSPIFGAVKMMQFFNPLMMPMYDVWQSASLGTFLNPIKGAEYIYKGISDTLKKSDNYWAAYENGLFSKPFSIPYDQFKNQFKEAMKGNKVYEYAKKAALPTNWLKMLYTASWHTAWKLDETIRMMSFNFLKDKGMDDRGAAQLAALAHGDYASVPPATRKILNKIFFTPTFKIVMAKYYAKMLEGMGEVGSKGFKASQTSKILGRGALLALAGMMGIKLFFESQGYTEEEMFRKYVKQVETDNGVKENVITLSHPFNIPWRYYYRIKNAWKPANLNVAEKLVEQAKWDLHPIWRVAYNVGRNENYRIYNPFDEKKKIALDISLYVFKEFVAISKGILESSEAGGIKAENFKILQKDMGTLKAIILKPFIFNYVRGKSSLKAARDVKALEREFTMLMSYSPSKNPEVNRQRIDNYRNKVREIIGTIEEDEPESKDYGGGVIDITTTTKKIPKDYGGGVIDITQQD